MFSPPHFGPSSFALQRQPSSTDFLVHLSENIGYTSYQFYLPAASLLEISGLL